jgi:hypothetical protein
MIKFPHHGKDLGKDVLDQTRHISSIEFNHLDQHQLDEVRSFSEIIDHCRGCAADKGFDIISRSF